MKRRIATVAMSLAMGAATGGVARSQMTVRRPIVPAATKVPVSPYNDGSDPLVTIHLEPSAVLSGRNGAVLEYQLGLASRSQKAASVRYSVEVTDDKGNPVQKSALSAVTQMPAQGGTGSGLVTPSGLPDGYFQIRVMAAASDGEEDSLQIAERYFVVSKNSVTPLSSEEWFARSNANQGRKL